MSIFNYRHFLCAPLALVVSAPSAPTMADVGSLRAWSSLTTSQSISPAQSSGVDHVVNWVGPNGRPVHLVVRVPVAARQKQVVTLSPGGGDAGPRIAAAAARVARGGVVRLLPGVYQIAGNANWRDPALLLSGLSDVTISGSGATLLFTRSGNGIRIADSNRVLITGLTLRYADLAMVLGRITPASDGPEVVLTGKGFTAPQLKIYQATVFDPGSFSYPPGGVRILLGPDGVMLNQSGDGHLAAGQLAHIGPGSSVAMKLGYYMGSVVDVRDSGAGEGSSDIVLDHIAVENGRGMGVTVSQMNRGFALVNSRIGPANLAELPESVAFDGVHIAAAAGDILIQNNFIQGTGDDGINLASPILDVLGSGSPFYVSTKHAEAVRAGDQLGLFDSQLNFLGAATVVGRSHTNAAGLSDVQLDRLPGEGRARYARDLRFVGNRYAVLGNVVGHNVGHGVLVQGPNGLVSGNHFNYLRENAIRMLTSSFWHEGAGVENVLVTNNQISNTGEEMMRGFPWAAIMVYGEEQTRLPASSPLASDIAITNNDVSNTANGCVSVQSALHVTVSGNRCDRTGSSASVQIDPLSTQDVRTVR